MFRIGLKRVTCGKSYSMISLARYYSVSNPNAFEIQQQQQESKLFAQDNVMQKNESNHFSSTSAHMDNNSNNNKESPVAATTAAAGNNTTTTTAQQTERSEEDAAAKMTSDDIIGNLDQKIARCTTDGQMISILDKMIQHRQPLTTERFNSIFCFLLEKMDYDTIRQLYDIMRTRKDCAPNARTLDILMSDVILGNDQTLLQKTFADRSQFRINPSQDTVVTWMRKLPSVRDKMLDSLLALNPEGLKQLYTKRPRVIIYAKYIMELTRNDETQEFVDKLQQVGIEL